MFDTRLTSKLQERGIFMPKLEEILLEALAMEGALGVALGDWRSGACLGLKSAGDPDFPERDLPLAIAGNAEVVRAKLKVAEALNERIQELVFTSQKQYHLIRLANSRGLFIFLALDKQKGNLALARIKLAQLAEQVGQLPLTNPRLI
jgi:predicted regulator of Ras-like GTPase activity (Roadblock/LC7/MglB family)